MKIFAGIFIIFIPFISIIPLIKNISKLMAFEENIQFPENISLLNSVTNNYSILRQHLSKELKLSKNEVSKICQTFKNTQLSVVFYIFSGIVQFVLIILYGMNIDWSTFQTNNINYLSLQCALILSSLVTFWIFYGQQFSEYIGFYRLKKTITNFINELFKLSYDAQKAIVTFFCSFIYFCILLLYLYCLMPVMQSICSKYPLIEICVLLFSFYYILPKLLVFIYSKIHKIIKHNDLIINENILYHTLQNNTYLHLLIIYFGGYLIQQENSQLLYGINILFLFDTYLQNRNTLLKEHLPNSNKGDE